MVSLILYFIVPILWLLIVSWFTGSKDYVFKTNDDERQQQIKQKAVVQSWATLILLFLTNFLLDVFQLRDERLADVPFVFPELLYLLVAVMSYFVFFMINTRKMSAA